MDIDGSYFFSDELEDLRLASSAAPPIPAHGREPAPEEGELVEGESLPEVTRQAIRSWFGI
jgi:hypothetical protein